GEFFPDPFEQCGVIGNHQHLGMGTAGAAETCFVEVGQHKAESTAQDMEPALATIACLELGVGVVFAAWIRTSCEYRLYLLVGLSIGNDAPFDRVLIAAHRADSSYIMHRFRLAFRKFLIWRIQRS